MIERTMKIELENGLEARPVAVLVQKASMHDSTIYIHAEGKKVNAKSIMGMMTLGLISGERVEVSADGEDESKAIENIENFLQGKI